MGTILTIAVYVFGALFFLYLLVSEFLDIIGRLEIIEKRWPPVYRAMSNRPMRLVLLVFLLALVAKDIQERAKEKSPEATVPPPPVVKFLPPAVPIVKFVESRPSSPNSTEHANANPVQPPAAQPPSPPQSAHDQLVSAQSQLRSLNSKWTEITNREAARRIAPASQVSGKTEEQRIQIEGESIALFYFTASEFGKEWQSFDQEISKIHTEAVERKARPGVHQWTANERDQDGQEFLKVLNQAEHVPTYSEIRAGKIPDRFTPLVNYLDGLQKVLGDFHD